MYKSRNQMKNLMVCVLLVMTLFFTMAMPVFAAEDPGPISEGDAENPAKASITKILKMPVGTTTPETDFMFDFEKVSLDDDKTENTKKAMPLINVKAEIRTGDTGSTPEGGGTKTVIKETGSIFETENMEKPWPRAGIYKYNVTERENTFEGASGESVIYSGAKYEFTVYVDNGPAGLYVAAVVVKILLNDASNSESSHQTKVDPTPGGDPNINGDYSKVVFTNMFLRNLGGEDPADKDNAVLTVSKEVTGLTSDQTKYFPFKITVTNPETVDDENMTYKAYVLNEKDEVVTDINNAMDMFTGIDDTYGKYIIFETEQFQIIFLAHGQRLVFTDLPVGSSFVIEESAMPKFTPEYVLTLNSSTGDAVTGSENRSLSTGEHRITEGLDSAAFQNMYRKVTPMGLGVDNLPYVFLLLVALATAAAYVTIRFRRIAYS